MSYKALYRKYRPSSFNEVVGQDHVVSTLKNVVLNNHVSHAYLFSGPRGTGKTSMAHIFAQVLNCQNLPSDTLNPCLQCESCKNINRNDLDIIEIDAASHNGVDEIRELINNAKYIPSISKYKVYIIDEVHMLSKGAFNAFLKILEEPPKHIIFILATTEVHKIPMTVLSRMQIFSFNQIGDNVIVNKLKEIMQKENVNINDQSLHLISKLARGSLRDALSILDQIISYSSNDEIKLEDISKIFGLIPLGQQIKFLNLAFDGQTKELLVLGTQLKEKGINMEQLTIALVDILKDFIIFEKTKDFNLLKNFNSKENFELLNLNIDFAYFALEHLVTFLNDLKFSYVENQLFDLMCLKLLDFNKNDNIKINTNLEEMNTNNNQEKNVENKNEFMFENFNSPKKDDSLNETTKEEPLIENEEEITPNDVNSNETTKEEPLIENEEEITPNETTKEESLIDNEEEITPNDVNSNETTKEESLIDNEEEITPNDVNKEEDHEIADITKAVTLDQEKELENDQVNHDIDDATKIVKLDNLDNENVVEDEILSTKEIETMNELKKLELLEKQQKEQENLKNLFDTINTEIKKNHNNTKLFNVEEILNLLVQASRKSMQDVKDKWDKILDYSTIPKYAKFVTLLEDSKIISAGKEFILLSSRTESTIQELNIISRTEDFLNFLKQVFDKSYLVFAITKKQFIKIKDIWKKLYVKEQLPKPKPISPINFQDEAKEFGTEVFGDKFQENKGS